jgi:hypothetical protein
MAGRETRPEDREGTMDRGIDETSYSKTITAAPPHTTREIDHELH